MSLFPRSDFFDGKVRLAIENGYQEVNTMAGSGYLLLSEQSVPGPTYLVAYEIITLFNPTQKHAGALGFMVGNHAIFEQAMKAGKAWLSYSPERTLDIRIVNLEADTANFKVQTRIGI
jgi:hypothetical protein